MTHRLLAPAALLFALIATDTVHAEPERDYRLINVVDEFLAYHDQCRTADEKTRIARWDSMLEQSHPQIFQHFIYRKKEGEEREAYKRDCIRRFWEEISPRMRAIAKLRSGIDDRVHKVIRDFRRHFPDFELETDICLTISLSFRGKVVDIDGRNVLALGLESLPGEGAQVEITLAHELFHLHHFRRFSPRGGLYRTLWTEGLATYASAVLVPGQKMSAVLGFPGAKVDRCGELLPQMAADLRRHMGERNQRLSRIYFGAEANDTDVPPEAGYYVGLVIVSKLAKEHPIAEMAQWEKDRVFRVLAKELELLE